MRTFAPMSSNNTFPSLINMRNQLLAGMGKQLFTS
ncbi:hypothetical protein PG1546B_1484 [Bifidobacterium pseudolongum subsp. globosum]|nr:hypothetical protein PG1565B_1484 [Bifidobacterium pseudolongum subsp. globosum]RYQ58744.1 hypothetical protein PG1546B_1484 [Bifidobacterium pseudolongum subsp. globosum]